jgi:hypothetical protein
MNCKYCKADCARRGEDWEKECRGYIPMTNADHIRSMTDEELAKWLAYFFEATLKENGVTRVALDPAFALDALELLKQPYKEDT